MMQCVCANCGALHVKLFSYIDALGRGFYFCNMQCKQHFFEVVYPAMLEKEKQDEKESSGILPQVRTLIAHKDKKGRVSILRSDGEIPPRSSPGND